MENLTTRDNQEAVGLLEVFGLVCAFLAADAGCKAANVHLQVFDKNKPANADALPVPLLVTIKFRAVSLMWKRQCGQQRQSQRLIQVLYPNILFQDLQRTQRKC